MSALAAPNPDSAVLTFLIADVRGYTAYTREAGDEAAARLAAGFAEIAREGVAARDGRVVELRGDEALAVFASPRQALRAAAELQAVFADEIALDPSRPLRVGIGLAAGEAVPVEDGYRGGALNLAARLCAVAGPGETVAAAALVQLAGAVDELRLEARAPVDLKGLAGPTEAFTVTPMVSAGSRLAARPRTEPPSTLDPLGPLVGRDEAARWLRWTWRWARRGPARAVAIVGPVGSGRTRLAAAAAELAARDGASIRYASGAARAGDIGEQIDAALGETGPGLLVLDDLESASSEDLVSVERLAGRVDERPLLVVALGAEPAPEPAARALRRLVDEGSTRRLGPVDATAVAAILRLYGAAPDDPAPVQAVLEASGGWPAAAHALAAEWAQAEATRRLGVSASQAAHSRRDLLRLEAEVSDNVVDLQLARERQRLYRGDDLAWSGAGQECPFKGLASFETADTDLFFGRERLVAEMVGRLAGSSFLGVVGPSGSGKSSAVRAGLVPSLAGGALPGSGSWTTVVIRPGEHPMRELDRALFAAMGEAERRTLAMADDPLDAAATVLGEARRPLVVVDQLEELFTTTTDAAERDAFVAALSGAAAAGRAVVVTAIRADFYGRCAEHPALVAALGAAHVLVGPMTADEYRRAIEGPARRARLRIDAMLVDALVGEVVDEPGGLPLLSTALVELWERREGRVIRMSAYEATGGVRGAVGRLAESAFGRLTESQAATARSIFLRLAAGEGETVVRQRVPMSDFDAATDADVGRTLAVMTDARLLTVDEGTVEVAHEALLREWPRLAGWLEEDREGRRLRRHLAASAREWLAAGHDSGELYRGARLSAALDWTTEHTLELNELERRFVAESRTANEREAERQRRTNRRLRLLLAAAGGALVVAVAAGGVALAQRGEAERAAAEAQAQRRAAEDANAKTETALTAADAQRLGAQALAAKDLDLSLLLAREGYALDDSTATRSNLLAAVTRSPAAIGIWRPLPGRLLSAAATPDGKSLLVTNNEGASAVIDIPTGRTRFVYPRTAGDGYVGLLGDDRTLIVFREAPRRVALLDLSDGSALGEIVFDRDAGGAYPAPDAASYAAAARDGSSLKVRDAKTQAVLRTVAPPTGMTFIDVWIEGDGSLIGVLHDGPLPDPVDAAFDQLVTLAWYPPGATRPTAMIPLGDYHQPWAVSPDGRRAAVGNDPEPGSITIVDLLTGDRRLVEGRHSARVQGVAFSPDGTLLGSGGDDRDMIVWEVDSGALVDTFTGHNGRLFAPAFSDLDGRLTAYTPSLDGTVIVWDVSGERRLGQPFTAGTGNEVELVDDAAVFDAFPAFALSPDDSLMAVAEAKRVVVRDVRTRQVVHDLPVGGWGTATDIAWSPTGDLVAVAGTGDAIVQLWDPATWTKVGAALDGPPERRAARDGEVDPADPSDDHERANLARAVAFSPDGRLVAAGTDDGRLWLWDAATGARVGDPVDTGWPIYDVAFDPTGQRVAAAFNEMTPEGQPRAGKASVWDVSDRRLLYTVSVDDDYARAGAVAFSPDGRTLATGGGTGVVRFWDAATGAATGRSVLAAAGWVLSIAWHPTEPTIVTSGTDGTVRLLDTDRRSQIGLLPGIDNVPATAAFSSDGTRIRVVYANGHGFDWTVDPADWARQACAVAGRTLSETEWEQYLPGRPYAPACE